MPPEASVSHASTEVGHRRSDNIEIGSREGTRRQPRRAAPVKDRCRWVNFRVLSFALARCVGMRAKHVRMGTKQMLRRFVRGAGRAFPTRRSGAADPGVAWQTARHSLAAARQPPAVAWPRAKRPPPCRWTAIN